MFRYKASQEKRFRTRRLRRFEKKENLQKIIVGDGNLLKSTSESSDGESISNSLTLLESTTRLEVNQSIHGQLNYEPDDFDMKNVSSEDTDIISNHDKLFEGSQYSVVEALKKLNSLWLDLNLHKSAVIKLLRTIKDLLPTSNNLPTTWNSVLRTLGHASVARTHFLCASCFQDLHRLSFGIRTCQNGQCKYYKKHLKSTQIVEIVHMDVRSQLQKILMRNEKLFNRTDLYPTTDICFGSYYKEYSSTSTNRITVIVHTDGAPLIKLSKQNLWPCFASLVELPPPVREYQENIVVMALWSSRIKPDPDIFLRETIDELKNLNINGITLFINDREFNINFGTQCFVSDLPAKALFCRTVNFNGYSACPECLSKGS
jgi:Transposase family tnp2